MHRFQSDFDLVGLGLSVAAVLVLLYCGLSFENFARDYWVAYAFWVTGFFGSILLGFAKRSRYLKLKKFLFIILGIGVLVLAFSAFNFGFAQKPQDVWGEKAGSAAVGIAEELFFGVFLIGIAINWLHVNRIIVIIGSAAIHSAYHIPQWGINPTIEALFFVSFLFARALYVLVFPKVGMIVGAHGVWNFLVSGGAVVKHISDLAVAWVAHCLDWVRV